MPYILTSFQLLITETHATQNRLFILFVCSLGEMQISMQLHPYFHFIQNKNKGCGARRDTFNQCLQIRCLKRINEKMSPDNAVLSIFITNMFVGLSVLLLKAYHRDMQQNSLLCWKD